MMRVRTCALASAILAVSASALSAQTQMSLADLDLSHLHQEWGKPQKNRSVDQNLLSIGGKPYASGVGSHANAEFFIETHDATRFTALVGVDDDAFGERGSGDGATVEFIILADGKIVFRSGVMKKGDAAKPVDIPLAGVKHLVLKIDGADDGISFDHANWVNAAFTYTGTAPRSIAPIREPGVILTPKPKPSPRINGARIHGASPGKPILIKIPITGERPLEVDVEGLPEGLTLDKTTRILSGSVSAAGEYKLAVRAQNAHGTATRDWKLVIGDDALSLTPPMGWNSWNVWGMAVDDAKVRAAADAFISSGLAEHGWTYINIDDGWQKHRENKDGTMGGPGRDADGNIVPNEKFPDMKALADYVHAKGLKIGIYSSPGPYTCGGCLGSFEHEARDAATYAAWGIDFLKYDWCSYRPALEADRGNPTTRPISGPNWNNGSTAQQRAEFQKPYLVMRDALRQQNRDIVYSLCQYGMGSVWTWGEDVDGQLWRTTDDITDTWRSMAGIGFSQSEIARHAKPGNWNDPDMLVVGHVGWGPNLRQTRLTPDEQYTHVSLWSLLASPLLIGCDLTRLDDFTLSLLTNDEVIDVNQDPLGVQARKVRDDGDLEIWAKPLEDGGIAVGLFNRSSESATITLNWSDLYLPTDASRDVRDLWRQESLGHHAGTFSTDVASHGVRFIKVDGK